MANFTLDLTKPGDEVTPFSLNLEKDESFTAKLAWRGKTDLDLHGLFCHNMGDRALMPDPANNILSTYNVIRTVRGGLQVGSIPKKPDGSFEIFGGAMQHSPDAMDGDQADIDEFIRILPSKLIIPSGGAIEIPLISMIHPHPQNGQAFFKNVDDAWVSVENSMGHEIMRINLSKDFGEFFGVQMGSIIIDCSGTQFFPIGVGFKSDFNGVIKNFL